MTSSSRRDSSHPSSRDSSSPFCPSNYPCSPLLGCQYIWGRYSIRCRVGTGSPGHQGRILRTKSHARKCSQHIFWDLVALATVCILNDNHGALHSGNGGVWRWDLLSCAAELVVVAGSIIAGAALDSVPLGNGVVDGILGVLAGGRGGGRARRGEEREQKDKILHGCARGSDSSLS